MWKDHPRLCGEKPFGICRLHTPSRITPAYAGKSGAGAALMIGGEDHPRLCGEKLITGGNSGVGLGSPPPMRGKVVDTRSKPCRVGITPAYAGKRLELNPDNIGL